jgi:hypothetical protein
MKKNNSSYKINENRLLENFNNNIISIKNLPNDKYYEIFSSSLLELKVINENDLINVTIIPKKINQIFNKKDFTLIHNFMICVLQKINDYQNSL